MNVRNFALLSALLTTLAPCVSSAHGGHGHRCDYEIASAFTELREHYAPTRQIDTFRHGLVIVDKTDFYICREPTSEPDTCLEGGMLNSKAVSPAIKVRDYYDAFKLVDGCIDVKFVGLRKENLPRPTMAQER